MNRSKIEWCDHTFNMITGCRHGCEYCYARQMVKRFSGDIRRNLMRTDEYEKVSMLDGSTGYVLEKPMINEKGATIPYPFGFEPTLHRYRKERLDALKRGNKVFVGAMADLFGEWVPDEWIREVFDACNDYPQHNYLFLTKNPERYFSLMKKEIMIQEENFWFGATVTDSASLKRAGSIPSETSFLSIEPILKPIVLPEIYLKNLKWIIIGAETGRRKGKVIPDPVWIKRILSQADGADIPVFMKDSLIPIMGKNNMRREFPKDLLERKVSPRTMEIRMDICNCCGKKMWKQDMVKLKAQTNRNTPVVTYGYMCWDCFKEHCDHLDIDVPDIPIPGVGKEKK